MGIEIINRNGTMEVQQRKELDGVVEAVFTHKIASTDATLNYNGPKIPPNDWHQMLSFFRWTYETYHSESQARMFIDPVDRTWVVWAFPQESGTGMSARELQTEEAATQRAALPHADQLILFGTVHHHCSSSAFQSGTDENNEKGQDGIHFTVGKISSDRHDLHYRLYCSGTKFTCNLATFWDVGEAVKALIPEDLHAKAAEHQMCAKVELPFPQQWRENMIEVKRNVTVYQGGLGYNAGGNGGGNSMHQPWLGTNCGVSRYCDIENAAKLVIDCIAEMDTLEFSEKTLERALEDIDKSLLIQTMARISRNKFVHFYETSDELRKCARFYWARYEAARKAHNEKRENADDTINEASKKGSKRKGKKSGKLAEQGKINLYPVQWDFSLKLGTTNLWELTRGKEIHRITYVSQEEARRECNRLNTALKPIELKAPFFIAEHKNVYSVVREFDKEKMFSSSDIETCRAACEDYIDDAMLDPWYVMRGKDDLYQAVNIVDATRDEIRYKVKGDCEIRCEQRNEQWRDNYDPEVIPTADEVAEATSANNEPQHGELNANGQYWDADQRKWVSTDPGVSASSPAMPTEAECWAME